MRRKMRWHKSTRFIIVILITVININGRINDIRILIKIRCKQNSKKTPHCVLICESIAHCIESRTI